MVDSRRPYSDDALFRPIFSHVIVFLIFLKMALVENIQRDFPAPSIDVMRGYLQCWLHGCKAKDLVPFASLLVSAIKDLQAQALKSVALDERGANDPWVEMSLCLHDNDVAIVRVFFPCTFFLDVYF